MKRCIRFLSQSTPDELSLAEVASTIRAVEGIEVGSHMHLWPIDEKTHSLEARIAVAFESPVSRPSAILESARQAIARDHGIEHVTPEPAPPRHSAQRRPPTTPKRQAESRN